MPPIDRMAQYKEHKLQSCMVCWEVEQMMYFNVFHFLLLLMLLWSLRAWHHIPLLMLVLCSLTSRSLLF